MATQRWKTLVGVGAFAAALVLLWGFFAPRPLGGSVGYVTTYGNSMAPHFSTGDLAVVRPADTYQVGDVVLYHSDLLQRDVLHRIVAVQNGLYTFKGDNNPAADPGSVPRDHLIGKLWFGVGGAGSWLSWLSTPWHAALFAVAVAGLALLLGGIARVGKRRRGGAAATAGVPTEPTRLAPQTAEVAGTTALVALVVGGVLALVAFTHPTTTLVPRTNAYLESGRFSYAATPERPSAAYPSGLVRTGQPVYLSVVDRARLRFAFTFSSAFPHVVHGKTAMTALVVGQDGWKHSIVLQPPTPYAGDVASAAGTLPLRALRAYLDRVDAAAGQTPGTMYTIELHPTVHVLGTVHGHPLDELFQPVLPMQLTSTSLRLDPVATAAPQPTGTGATAAAVSPLEPQQQGSIDVVRPAELSLGRLHVPVVTVRRVSVAVVAVAALVLLWLGVATGRRRRTETTAVPARRRHLVVDVASTSRPGGPTPVDVTDFDSLVRLAERYGRMILRESRNGVETFVVEEDGAVYRFRAVPPPAPEPAPAPSEPAPPATAPVPTFPRAVGDDEPREATAPALRVLGPEPDDRP